MPEDNPKFIEVELLIDKLLRPSHLRDLEQAIACDEIEGNSLTLAASNVLDLISQTNRDVWYSRGLGLSDLANGGESGVPHQGFITRGDVAFFKAECKARLTEPCNN